MQKNVRPSFTVNDARCAIDQHYALQPQSIVELSAELDRNFYVRDKNGLGYVLKIAYAGWSDSELELQTAVLEHLAPCVPFCPKLVPTRLHQDMALMTGANGQPYRARLLTFLEGTPLADFQPHSPALLHQIGERLGQLSSAMQSFDHPAKRLDYRWNILNFAQVQACGQDLPVEKYDLVAHYGELFAQVVLPRIHELRQSFVYNDANDHNILVTPLALDQVVVSGMIDFGDMVYSLTIAELAVALSYVMMGKEDPLAAASAVIRGYHSQFQLTEDEVSLLYTLIAARLCISVCISLYQQRQEPDNAHLSISETAAWDLLARWRAIHPQFAHAVFRAACDWSPHPAAQTIHSWLKHSTFQPVLGMPLTDENTVVFDLSIGSADLGAMDVLADAVQMTRAIFERLDGGKIGIGRYDEARAVYTSDKYAIRSLERRTIHIGVDLFAPAGTALFAPLDGVVHGLRDNGPHQDYGPTLILKHQPEEGISFYTLYGHLDSDVLERWCVGQTIRSGQAIATIGGFPQNGGWTPHLHFQIILDMFDYDGDYPGVVAPRFRDVWLSVCPDPNVILGVPTDVHAPRPADNAAIIAARHEYLNPSMSISYKHPLQIERGYLHYLYDDTGQPYLDCVNNVPHVGHSHPRVVRTAQQQMTLLNTNTRYLHKTIVEYAQRLCATLPEPLSVCFLVNSGSEANELAIRLAQAYTGGTDFIVIDHAYHGHTSSLIDLSPYKFNGRGGKGKPDHVEIAMLPDGYRGQYRGFGSDVGRGYAQSVADAAQRITTKEHKLAAFFSEGILSCGGQLPLPANYLKTAFEHVRAAGGVCIADEVQIGFGRVGSHMWAFETQDVIPDIVTMGKPIGNGHPLGAVVTTRAIADAFNNGMEYFNTFGGNPVSCAIGVAVLNIIEEEGLQHNAHDVGAYFQEQLLSLQARFPLIGHVRGHGLFLGVEFVRNQATLEPADVETSYVVERMLEKGFLVSSEGPLHNVIKIKPPIIFQKEHVDMFVHALADVLSDTVLKNAVRARQP